MKKNLFLIAAAAIMMMTGCSKNNTMTVDGTQVSKEIVKAFNAQHPNATNVKWAKRGAYTIANFDLTTTKAAAAVAGSNTAWYDDAANCRMTELDYDLSTLKEKLPVIWTAFNASKYASCHVDDIDQLSRDGYATVYILEVEGKLADGTEIDVDLYFSEEGVLLRELPDGKEDDDDDKYDTMISEVDLEKFNAFLAQRYPDFLLVEADAEDDGTYEIEILVNRDNVQVKIEVVFDKDAKFMYESVEIDFDKAPKAVQDFVKANYKDAEVDEFEVQTDAKNVVYYVFEYETEVDGKEVEVEVALTINEAGEVVVVVVKPEAK